MKSSSFSTCCWLGLFWPRQSLEGPFRRLLLLARLAKIKERNIWIESGGVPTPIKAQLLDNPTCGPQQQQNCIFYSYVLLLCPHCIDDLAQMTKTFLITTYRNSDAHMAFTKSFLKNPFIVNIMRCKCDTIL